MFLIKDKYYPESSVVKITIDNIEKTVKYYFAGNVEKSETFADDSAFNTKVSELEAIFVKINGCFYDPFKVQTVTRNGKTVTYIFIGNVLEQEVFDDDTEATQKITESFGATHIEVNGVFYNGKALQIVEKNEAALKVVYLFAGKDKITATYDDNTAFNNAIKAVEDLNKGGSSEGATTQTPVFSVQPGEVVGGTKVAITCPTEGATIYFTTDGTTPTLESEQYDSEITIPQAGLTIKAIAVKLGLATSKVASATYTVSGDEGVFYKGWLLGNSEIEALDESDILGMAGLETGTTESASSPNPNVYTAPEGILPDGGRIVWAYPAIFGKVTQYIDGLGEHAIGDSYTNVQVTVNGVPLEVYFLTTSITPDVSEEIGQVFVA